MARPSRSKLRMSSPTCCIYFTDVAKTAFEDRAITDRRGASKDILQGSRTSAHQQRVRRPACRHIATSCTRMHTQRGTVTNKRVVTWQPDKREGAWPTAQPACNYSFLNQIRYRLTVSQPVPASQVTSDPAGKTGQYWLLQFPHVQAKCPFLSFCILHIDSTFIRTFPVLVEVTVYLTSNQ